MDDVATKPAKPAPAEPPAAARSIAKHRKPTAFSSSSMRSSSTASTRSSACPASRSPTSRASCRPPDMRVISFRHEQNAGLRRVDRRLHDAEARHLPHGVRARLSQRTDGARQRHHQLLPDDPHQRLERARDRRPAAGRLRGDGPARDRQAATPRPRSACCTPRTSAWASRGRSAPRSPAVRAASISTCRPSCSRRRSTRKRAGIRSSRSSIRRRARSRRRTPCKRALDLLKGAKRPLIILGKGAAYAQADADIRALVEKTGIPYLPMSMAKGLLPDTHEQSASAARSYVLPEADVVMLIGARLNWLLSHGKGKTWGGNGAKAWGGQKFVQIDISPQEADSNVRIDAPVVGDIGSCVAAMLDAIGRELAEAARRLARRHRGAQDQERREDGGDAGEEPVADELPQRAQRRARHRQGESGRHPRQRGRERARLHAQHRGHVQAAQAAGRRHVGRHGHRHGLLGRRGRGQRRAGDRDRGRQRLRLLRHGDARRSAATTCRCAS